MNKRKTRMISFRVSEQEFEQLRASADTSGARSVSDYARLAICGGAEGTNNEDFDSGIRTLSGDVRQLSRDIQLLAGLIETRAALPATDGNGHKDPNGNGHGNGASEVRSA